VSNKAEHTIAPLNARAFTFLWVSHQVLFTLRLAPSVRLPAGAFPSHRKDFFSLWKHGIMISFLYPLHAADVLISRRMYSYQGILQLHNTILTPPFFPFLFPFSQAIAFFFSQRNLTSSISSDASSNSYTTHLPYPQPPPHSNLCWKGGKLRRSSLCPTSSPSTGFTDLGNWS
jgi:hypothetical protein